MEKVPMVEPDTVPSGNTLERAQHWRFIDSVDAFLRTICPDEPRGRWEW